MCQTLLLFAQQTFTGRRTAAWNEPMPRATTEKFSRAHQPAPKKKESQASGSNTNPLFNTARFGQHILKNPATAQKSVFSYLTSTNTSSEGKIRLLKFLALY
jgi:hypothetical protein